MVSYARDSNSEVQFDLLVRMCQSTKVDVESTMDPVGAYIRQRCSGDWGAAETLLAELENRAEYGCLVAGTVAKILAEDIRHAWPTP